MPGALNMVQMRVRDWPAAVTWYSKVLRCGVVVREPDDQFALLQFPDGGADLALLGTEPSGGSNCVPYIEVKDLDSAMLGLREHSVKFVGPSGAEEGFRTAQFSDPEGNVLYLYEYVRHGRGDSV